jgi:hypothetical protein
VGRKIWRRWLSSRREGECEEGKTLCEGAQRFWVGFVRKRAGMKRGARGNSEM